MMNWICNIPESFGWAMVGFLVALCAIMGGILVSYLVQYIKDCRTEEEEN